MFKCANCKEQLHAGHGAKRKRCPKCGVMLTIKPRQGTWFDSVLGRDVSYNAFNGADERVTEVEKHG